MNWWCKSYGEGKIIEDNVGNQKWVEINKALDIDIEGSNEVEKGV